MQFLIELLAALVVWTATLVFAQFGIEVDLSRPAEARHERTVQRTPSPRAEPAAQAAEEDCPEARAARLRRV